MNAKKHVLLVHGYSSTSGTGPMEAVCKWMLQYRHRFTHFLLLGGKKWPRRNDPLWHLTIGIEMEGKLVASGMPKEQIILPDDVLKDRKIFLLPCRDLIEEAALASMFLGLSGWSPDSISYEILCAEGWERRIKRIYSALETPGMPLSRIPIQHAPCSIGKSDPDYPSRLTELVSRFDPLGKGLISGIPFRMMRKRKTSRLATADRPTIFDTVIAQ